MVIKFTKRKQVGRCPPHATHDDRLLCFGNTLSLVGGQTFLSGGYDVTWFVSGSCDGVRVWWVLLDSGTGALAGAVVVPKVQFLHLESVGWCWWGCSVRMVMIRVPHDLHDVRAPWQVVAQPSVPLFLFCRSQNVEAGFVENSFSCSYFSSYLVFCVSGTRPACE